MKISVFVLLFLLITIIFPLTRGEMEVQKSRNLSTMHCGVQAYLSTLASPKVAEVVNQFPVKVTLNEVPRLSTWPSQFQDIGAKEGHVALFFFAKDIER